MVPLTQLFFELTNENTPALSYIVPNQCDDMHNLGNPLSPCANYTDDQIVARGDREVEWLVTSIMGSRTWYDGRNVIFIVFDEATTRLCKTKWWQLPSPTMAAAAFGITPITLTILS